MTIEQILDLFGSNITNVSANFAFGELDREKMNEEFKIYYDQAVKQILEEVLKVVSIAPHDVFEVLEPRLRELFNS